MKILLKELSPGVNTFTFEIPQVDLDAMVKEADDLYFARAGAAKVEFGVEKIDDILTLRGSVHGDAGFECARCLKENARSISVPVRWTLVPKSAVVVPGMSAEEEVELTTDDLDVSFFDGEEVDLLELAREAVLLDLDPAPRCEVDSCEFQAYAAAPSEEAEPEIDPRWAPLMAMKDKLKKQN